MVFYLTNAVSITRWAELKHTARAAITGFLDTIVEDFELPAIASGWELTVADTARGYRHHLIAPPSTPSADDDTPAIAVCFGWNKRVQMEPGDYTPFAGIRIGIGGRSAEWRAAFMDGPPGAREVRDRRRYRPGTEWPAWKRVEARARWWEDLNDYRRTAHAAMGDCLNDFATPIEQAVSQARIS